MATDVSAEPGRDEIAARLSEFGVRLDPEVPYRLETMFPKLEGWGAKGDIKRKGKFIREVEPVLKQMLHPDEQVLYLAKGVQYSFAEQYFMGIWAMTINQTVFVLTNVRLLMIRTNSKGRPKETFWMVYYSQIEKFKGGLTGMMNLKLADGKKLSFSGFAKTDRKQMPQVFEQALAAYRKHDFNPQVTQSMENLCSYCFTRVPRDEYECPRCGAEFWKPSHVALRSYVFPCWGDIVLKHYIVGAAEFFGYLVTWVIIFVLVGASLANGEWFGLLFAPFLLLLAHGLDGTLTYHVAKKGLHPRRGPRDETDVEFEDV